MDILGAEQYGIILVKLADLKERQDRLELQVSKAQLELLVQLVRRGQQQLSEPRVQLALLAQLAQVQLEQLEPAESRELQVLLELELLELLV
jgi:hypothetical protein